MEKLDKIIHEHLMSMDFDAHSDKCTPTERALFFRMKDVTIAYANQQTTEMQKEIDELKVAIHNVTQSKDAWSAMHGEVLQALKESSDYNTTLKQSADEMANSLKKYMIGTEIEFEVVAALENYKKLI